MYAICFAYDRDYISGNAPHGIRIIQSSDNYYSLVDKFIADLKTIKDDAEFEFGWNLEYRLCILEYSEDNKIIRGVKYLDQDDTFWLKQTIIHPFVKS